MNEDEEARFLLDLEKAARDGARQVKLLQAQRSEFAERLLRAARYLQQPVEVDVATQRVSGGDSEVSLERLPRLNEIREADTKYLRQVMDLAQDLDRLKDLRT